MGNKWKKPRESNRGGIHLPGQAEVQYMLWQQNRDNVTDRKYEWKIQENDKIK